MAESASTIQSSLEQATLAGGCFWCVEAALEMIKGVQSVVSGYAGGSDEHPTYESVCRGRTGHAEVVQITFDPTVISYRDLLAVFFSIHDPTTLNRQGADVGTQYRSAIYYHSEEQKRFAQEMIAEVQASLGESPRIVTEVTALPPFYRAEDYHQGYFRQHPEQGYCQAVISPKVAKVRKHFAGRLKS